MKIIQYVLGWTCFDCKKRMNKKDKKHELGGYETSYVCDNCKDKWF